MSRDRHHDSPRHQGENDRYSDNDNGAKPDGADEDGGIVGDAIGALKAMFDQIVAEPLPEKFQQFVAALLPSGDDDKKS